MSKNETPNGKSIEPLRDFEVQAIRALVTQTLGEATTALVLAEAEFVSYEYTGCGYFLTISHPDLPLDRSVCSGEYVVGRAIGFVAEFIVFIEDGRLVLECYTCGDRVPADFRDLDVTVSINVLE